MMFLVAITYLFTKGVGIWGIDVPVMWGFAIVNFVWWIGIGHAGTLISAILLLLKQDWRTSINRFAEAMTLFAVACAGLFPLLHLGRPWVFYWLLPLSEHDGPVAPVAQPPDLGRLRGLDLRHRLAPVLVRRTPARPGHACAIGRGTDSPGSSTGSSRWAGAARPATGTATGRPTCCWRGWRLPWSCRSTRSSRSISPSASCRAGTARSSPPISWPGRSSRASRWS